MPRAIRTALVFAIGCVLPVLPGCMGAGDAQVDEPVRQGPTGELACAPEPPPATPTRLLTRQEYDNTVRDLLGDTSRPAAKFPPEPRVLGFENNAGAHRANPLLVSAYLDAAEALAARAMEERRDVLVPCDPAVVGEAACGAEFLDRLLTRAFRRPPTNEERQRLSDFFEKVRTEEASFDTAVEWTLQVVLQAPQFLYRTEAGGRDGTDAEGLLFDPYELASRLSYFLWASMPDDLLLEAAGSGGLDTREGVMKQARRMLADPRSAQSVQSFFRQWLHLDGMEKIEKVSLEDDAAVALGWKRGTERFIESVWQGSGRLSDFLTQPVYFVDAATAPLYGVEAPEGEALQRIEAPGERAGLLTQPGLMALLSGSRESSPIMRGVFVRERLLCQHLAAPPADVPLIPPDPDPNATTRDRFAEHTSNPSCAGCHQLIDPLGFGFEQYDELGRFRTTENELPVDASGSVTKVNDEALVGAFDGAVQLAERMSQSALVHDCAALQMYRFALGRLEAKADTCALQEIQTRFRESGGDFRELLVAVAASHAFRTRALPASMQGAGAGEAQR